MTRAVREALGYYQGAEAEEYFRWQDQFGPLAGVWNAPLFQSHIRATDSVLDFGCGAGHLLAALTAGRRMGVEVNPFAREVGQRYSFSILGALQDLGPEQFDVVISSHALEHVPSPLEILVALESRLRAGGRMLLLLPLDDWRDGAQRQYRAPDINMHLYCWTPRALANLLRTAGLVPASIDVVKRAFPPFPVQLWQAGRACFEASARITAVLRRRRQLFAVASREGEMRE